MTRREWLQKNPPPRAAGTLRQLLEELKEENKTRDLLTANRKTFEQHVAYWNQQMTNARMASDTVTLNHANAQLTEVQAKIADIDKQLAASVQVPTRIAELEQELTRTAKCPTHHTDLVRHKNRPDDLFLCSVGPHFFLWTKANINDPRGTLIGWQMKDALPDIDGAMEWI